MTKFISVDNAIFVLYSACLNGEIPLQDFLRSKEIIKRAKQYTASDILDIDALMQKEEQNT